MTYNHALRGRCSLPGVPYIVTAVTAQRLRLFQSFDLAAIVARELHRLDLEQACELLAWVVMPDHLHALISVRHLALPEIVQRLKGRSALAINRQRLSKGRVWQQGYHDHALRREENVVVAARYIVANPLRAGLVQRLGQYPFWDQRLVPYNDVR